MEYKEIKIYLHTNLEELSDDKRTILFESTKLIHPEIKNRTGLKRYPSVSFRVRQNYSALSELNFNQKMQFFFDTRSHISLLRIFPKLFDKETNQYNEKNPTKFFKEYNEIIKDNVMSMLQLLFVTSALNAANVTSSWDFVVDKFTFPSLPSVYGFFQGASNNSMLDVNGKKYSFDRLVWMNDILNCPVYADLFIKYREFIRWRKNEIQKLEASAIVNTDERANIDDLIPSLRALEKSITDFLLKFRELPENQPNYRNSGPWPPVEGQTNNKYANIPVQPWIVPLYRIKALLKYLDLYKNTEEKITNEAIQSSVLKDLKTVLKSDEKYQFPGLDGAKLTMGFDLTKLDESFKTLFSYSQPNGTSKSGTTSFTYPSWTEATNRKEWRNSPEYKPYEYDQIKPAIDEVKAALDKYYNAKTSGNKTSDITRKRIEVLNDLLNKTYEHIRDEYREKAGRDRDAQYSYFIEQYIRSRLSYANKSTNTLLQNLINLQTDKETKRFFEFLNRAYEYFYEGKGKAFKDGEEDAELLYSGVNSKYEGNNLAPIYEIHVLCDLYLGTTGKLYGKQNCGQKGEELGKNLELVLTRNVDTLEKNRQKWDLNYRRIMYSPSDSGVTDDSGKERGQGQGQGQGQSANNINTNLFQEILEYADKAKRNAPNPQPNSEITHWEPKNSVSFMDAINGYYNQYSELRDDRNFTKESALFIIKESKDPDEHMIYDLFVEFNKQLFQFSQKLLDKLVRQIGIYKSTIQQAQSQQDEYIRVYPTRTNDVAYVKLSLKCEKNYFFQCIVEEMMRREKEKPKLNILTGQSPGSTTGGRAKRRKTRRARISKKRFTRRNNYSRLH